MKKICSYLYTKLADVELDPEPQVESEDIELAMEYIGSVDGLLGPIPINLETLSASPAVYAKFIWRFLEEMEQEILAARGSVVVEKCDMGWLKIELNKYPMFMSLTNRKKKKVRKCVLQIINGDDPRFHIRYDLDPSFIEALTALINTTRNRLQSSRLFLAGDTMIDPNVL
jgi:hypothetical protein